MRDVNVIAIECMRELENIGIKCGNVIKIDINTRAKKRWGQCRKIGNNYIIEVNQILLREDTDIDGLKNTIIHELLHTCKGCMKHTGEWKQLAEKVNRYYGYNIKRCDSAYANYEESDENGNTIVVNDKNEILSNNIFANNDFMQALEQVNAGKLQALYISDKMKENIDLLRESGYFDS